MLYLKDENHQPQKSKTEDERIIDALNQAQDIGKERTTRLRGEWIRLQETIKNLEKDYERRLKTIPLLETDIEILSEGFIAPIQRIREELKLKKKTFQENLLNIKNKTTTFSMLSPTWHREVNSAQQALDRILVDLEKQNITMKTFVSNAKQRATEQAKINNKLNLHRMKGIKPLKWKIDDLKLVNKALEARSLAVSACVLARNSEKAISMANIWNRIQQKAPISMEETYCYMEAEREDLQPKEVYERINLSKLQHQESIGLDVEARIQEVTMAHSQALIESFSNVLLQLSSKTNAPSEGKPIVDIDFVEFSIEEFSLEEFPLTKDR